MAATDDYYRVLEVEPTASPQEIRLAYRRLARRFHPDRNPDPGAEERFRLLTEAYEVLSDDRARAEYDRRAGTSPRAPQPFDLSTGRAAHVGIDLGGLLGGLLRGAFGARAGTVSRGIDVEAEIGVSVEDAYHGGAHRLAVQTSGGSHSIEVVIPAGVTEGQRIRLPGQGATGTGGGPRGDLYLVVRLAPHPRYRVDDRDIVVDLPITPWEAVLGAGVTMDTPGGPVQVRVPAGSSSGRRLRFHGRGLPGLGGPAGDLYAQLSIVVPERLSDRQRELWRRLAEASRFDPRGRRAA
ncbi:DnaJ domain-containing protein [Dactylosporangium roseum]|uniref:DnaJ domain-containing protein n=1 Tax=Dactylosporangium roseum TaxID=47989 RepID=A0ABY5YYR4_9ACTN|nr:DnaJ C-terminal domain-containing protein [Dactylosporangium roseum]UWZ33960.1 DnaJ domain-containing protein [Dactylosporangium roseum]